MSSSSSSSSLPDTLKAIRIHKHGPASVLQWDDNVPLTKPAANEVTIEIAYAGVNYVDTYHRTGLYTVSLPYRIGREGSGLVRAVGDNAKKKWSLGQRVVFANGTGSYATYINVDEKHVVPLPNEIDLSHGAALMLQGFTAHYLVHSTFPVSKHSTVLIHAAAGGTGQLLVQLAKRAGGRVIATVGSAEKAALVNSLGADHVINYNETKDFATVVRQLTDGKGVECVYDGVGLSTFEGSLRSLRRRGYLVLFGNASGAVPPIDPLALTRAGSVFLTRPTMNDYLLDDDEIALRANDLFEAVRSGQLKLSIGKVFDVHEAVQAHEALESRKVAGKILLKVNDRLNSSI